MRRFFLFILVPCLLTSLGTPGFSEKPLRLFFEKDTTSNQVESKQYKVKDGDYLFKILLKHGYTNEEIYKILPSIQQNNPHIPDMDRLLPGQNLYIPRPQSKQNIKNPESNQKKEQSDSKSSIQKPYIVRSGDTLVSMLHQQGIPGNLIFSKYMQIFQEQNPGIRDINDIREGQNVILPVPSELHDAKGSAAETNASTATDQANSTPFGALTGPSTDTGTSMLAQIGKFLPLSATPAPNAPPLVDSTQSAAPVNDVDARNETNMEENRTPLTGFPYVKNVLGEMRFTFASGDEELYPLPDNGWLQVKLNETPLLTTPWGEKIILCPAPKNSEWIDKAKRLNMRICSVSADWSLPDVLDRLAATFPEQIRIWEAGQDLALSRNSLGLTVKAPSMVIIQHRGQKMIHALWGRHNPDERPLPQGLPEVLQDMRVKIIEMDQFNEITRLPSRPRQSIYVPVADRTELIRALNPDNPEELFGPTLPEDLNALLRLLKSKNMLREGFANLDWSGGMNRRIALQVPAWIIGPASRKVILLDRRFADEYLVSLLAHEGYSSFVLPD